MRQFFARLCLFTGLLCFILLIMLLYQRYRPNPLAFQGAVFTRQLSSESSETPVQITIQSVELDLPVINARINGNMWDTTEKGVSYLSTTPLPGTSGNSVFYGHNWPNLLGPLHNVHVGDHISVTLSSGAVVRYTVAYITVVHPNQVKILENSDDSRLTLYTCTGILDSKRLVITALLNEAK